MVGLKANMRGGKRSNNASHHDRAGIIQYARAAGREVDAIDDLGSLGRGVGEGRDQRGEPEELSEEVDHVPAVGKPAWRTEGEIDAVGQVVGFSLVLEEVVVAVVHQRAPEHEHTFHFQGTSLVVVSLFEAAMGVDMGRPGTSYEEEGENKEGGWEREGFAHVLGWEGGGRQGYQDGDVLYVLEIRSQKEPVGCPLNFQFLSSWRRVWFMKLECSIWT